MPFRSPGGFRLIDLILIVFIVGSAFGLITPMLSTSHDSGHRPQCQSNMRQVGLALIGYMNAHGRLPNAGTFRDDPAIHRGDPLRSSIYAAVRAPESVVPGATPWLRNWVVDVLPYLDEQELYNAWNFDADYLSPRGAGGEPPRTNLQVSTTSLKVLKCRLDETTEENSGNLSYVVNGGFARWHAIPVEWDTAGNPSAPRNGGVLQWLPVGRPWQGTMGVTRHLGVMFLGTDKGDAPWDVKTTPHDFVDGASQTLLVGENVYTGVSKGGPFSGGRPTNWACPLPTYAMFLASDDVCHSNVSTVDCFAGGQLRTTASGAPGPGWVRANRRGSPEGINGGHKPGLEGASPFVNSPHQRGANFVFCDGAVRFLSETIDGTVYAHLISPADQGLPGSIRPPVDSNLMDEVDN